MLPNEERYILLDRIERLENCLKETILDYEEELHELNQLLELAEYYHDLKYRPVKNHLKEVSSSELEFYAD